MEENKMVKSKKMSKTSIAVIILSLLLVLSMVLSLTGAWFTAGNKAIDPGQGSNVHFGTFGNVTVTLSAAEWKEHNQTTGALQNVDTSARDYYMPGDLVTSTGVKFEYEGGSEGKVYYLIGMQHVAANNAQEAGFSSAAFSYFTINGSGKFVPVSDQSPVAGELTLSKSVENHTGVYYGLLEVQGVWRTIEVDFDTNPDDSVHDYKYYQLDGDISTAATAATAQAPGHSWQIENHAQGLGLVGIDGISADGSTRYVVRVIQSSNLTAAQAYEALVANMDGSAQSPVTVEP